MSTLTESQRETLRRLAPLCEALQDFSSDIKNHIAAAVLTMQLTAETPVQAETHRARTIEALRDALTLFKECGL